MPRLTDVLNNIDAAIFNIFFSNLKKPDDAGHYNNVYFFQSQKYKALVHESTLALYIPRVHGDVLAKQIAHSQACMQRNNCRSPFIQNILYYDDKGRKISLKATSNLRRFCHNFPGQLNEINVKKIIGQIVSGLFCMHTANIVHRDIKMANILIHNFGVDLCIQIADLDSIVNVDEFGSSNEKFYYHCGSKYLAPELVKGDRHKADLRSADCYALGVVLLEFSSYIKDPELKNSVASLSRLLTCKKETRRMLLDIMEHSFFGVNELARKSYFDSLLYTATHITDISLSQFAKMNNCFLLYSLQLKSFFMKINFLINQINTMCLTPYKQKCIWEAWHFLTALQNTSDFLNILQKLQCLNDFKSALRIEENIVFECAWPILYSALEEKFPWAKVPQKIGELIQLLQMNFSSGGHAGLFANTFARWLEAETTLSKKAWLNAAKNYFDYYQSKNICVEGRSKSAMRI